MLTPYDIAAHWPLWRRQIALERTPRVAEVLDDLARGVVMSYGGPVRMAPRALRSRGVPMLTAGEAAHRRAILRDLAGRGVVSRECDPRGAKAALWIFTTTVGRWRLPWVFPNRREVERAISGCAFVEGCPQGARVSQLGRLVVASVDDEFKLPESDHLGVYIAQHSTNGRPTLDPRTGRIADLREQLSPPRQSTLDTPPLYLASMTGESKPPPTPHDNVEPAASEHGDGDGGRARHNPDDIALPPGRIDEAVCAVVDVIERETGGRVYPGSQPHDELREAVTIAGQGFAALADDLAENIHGLRSPSVAAGRALALAPGAAAAQHDKRRAKEAGDRARLTQLARIVDMGGVENLTDDELREFRELGARVTSLGGDED